MAQSPRPSSPLPNYQSIIDKKPRNSHKISEDTKIVIMPCKCAPSCQQVQSWLQAKEDYEHVRKKPVIKSLEIEKATESLNCLLLSKNPCCGMSKTSENTKLPSLQVSKPVVNAEEFCFSSDDPSLQTIEKCDTNIAELNKTAVKRKALPLFLAAALDTDRDEEDYVSYSSPDSPVFPSWQKVTSPHSKQSDSEDSENMSSLEENETVIQSAQKLVKKEGKISSSVSPLVSKERDGNSENACFHSTPIRDKIFQGRMPEALEITPLLPGKFMQDLICSQRKSELLGFFKLKYTYPHIIDNVRIIGS